ncbi:receptor-like serine/threonine-protein kinase ALE2 [Tanacetum coccineum]
MVMYSNGSSENNGNGGSYGHGNNGRDIKPLGVDISKQRSSNRLSGGKFSIIVLSAVVAVVQVTVVVWVLLVKRREGAQSRHTPPATLLFVIKSSGVGGSTIGSRPESDSLSFRSNIAYNESAKTFSSSNMEKEVDNFNELGILGEGGFGRVYSGTFEDETEAAVKEVAALDWRACLKISLGVAQGLAYFHEDSSLRFIHRDFKSSNILLEQDFTPKVSYFGLA